MIYEVADDGNHSLTESEDAARMYEALETQGKTGIEIIDTVSLCVYFCAFSGNISSLPVWPERGEYENH